MIIIIILFNTTTVLFFTIIQSLNITIKLIKYSFTILVVEYEYVRVEVLSGTIVAAVAAVLTVMMTMRVALMTNIIALLLLCRQNTLS